MQPLQTTCQQPAPAKHASTIIMQPIGSQLAHSISAGQMLDMVLCSQAVHTRFPLPACTPTPCAYLEVTDSHELVLLQPEVLQPDQVAQRSQPLACETAALRHIQEGQRCEALQHLQATRM